MLQAERGFPLDPCGAFILDYIASYVYTHQKLGQARTSSSYAYNLLYHSWQYY